MAFGPKGNHASQETYSVAPTSVSNNNILRPDPGYVKPIRAQQFGPQGNTSPGQAHNWPDTFQRP